MSIKTIFDIRIKSFFIYGVKLDYLTLYLKSKCPLWKPDSSGHLRNFNIWDFWDFWDYTVAWWLVLSSHNENPQEPHDPKMGSEAGRMDGRMKGNTSFALSL